MDFVFQYGQFDSRMIFGKLIGSREISWTDYGRIIGKESGTGEREGCYGLGKAYEWAEGAGRGSSDGGADLCLTAMGTLEKIEYNRQPKWRAKCSPLFLLWKERIAVKRHFNYRKRQQIRK